MERAEMEARADELGVKYRSNTPDEALAERIAEAEAVPETVRCKVLWGNVWSSQGKHLKGEEIDLSLDDFASLDAVDAIKRVS